MYSSVTLYSPYRVKVISCVYSQPCEGDYFRLILEISNLGQKAESYLSDIDDYFLDWGNQFHPNRGLAIAKGGLGLKPF